MWIDFKSWLKDEVSKEKCHFKRKTSNSSENIQIQLKSFSFSDSTEFSLSTVWVNKSRSANVDESNKQEMLNFNNPPRSDMEKIVKALFIASDV